MCETVIRFFCLLFKIPEKRNCLKMSNKFKSLIILKGLTCQNVTWFYGCIVIGSKKLKTPEVNEYFDESEGFKRTERIRSLHSPKGLQNVSIWRGSAGGLKGSAGIHKVSWSKCDKGSNVSERSEKMYTSKGVQNSFQLSEQVKGVSRDPKGLK